MALRSGCGGLRTAGQGERPLETATRQRKSSKSIRAHELAHELGLTWRELQEFALREGVGIRNQLCGLDTKVADQLREAYRRSLHEKKVSPPAVEPTVEQKEQPLRLEGYQEVPSELVGQKDVSQVEDIRQPQPASVETKPDTPIAAVSPDRRKELLPETGPIPPTIGDNQAVTAARQVQQFGVSPIAMPSSAEPISRPTASESGAPSPASTVAPASSTSLPHKEVPRPPGTGVGPGAAPSASLPSTIEKTTTSAPSTAGPRQTKHLVDLDKLRRRQLEKKQEQARQQTGPAPTPSEGRPQAGSAPRAVTPTSPGPPSAPTVSSSGTSSTGFTPPPVKPSSSGPIPVLQKPKSSGPAASTPPDVPTQQQKPAPAPAVSFVVRKQVTKPAKEKPPKQPQELKPLATLEEVLKQQQKEQQKEQQAKPPTPAPTQLKAPAKAKPDAKLLTQVKEIKDLQFIAPDEEEEEGRPAGKRRPGAVPGREERRQRRREEARLRAAKTAADTFAEPDLEAEAIRPVARRVRAEIQPAAPRPITQPRKGKVPIEPPITVRSLSEALGVSVQDLLRKLVQRGQMLNINATLPDELAEELALEYNLELEIKKPADPEEEILKHLLAPDKPEDLVSRPPVVTVMGHVDHGKTSLLDRIRESDVASTEAGGITQHLRAWQVEHGGRRITFLDTPGHEAFTAMRARGAHVTDIVVLVVAADDGVMPQTEEAISHARAANVPMIVAINKVDLPNANVQRTRNQLYSLGLIPDTMGGDTPFVETVAAKDRPRGIQELLDMISLVAELRELRANPNKPAIGTCLEAKITEGQGVVATLLVQNGTLHVGDPIVCGTSYGRVRAMSDSNGRPVQQAGPATPVAVTGLDEVPDAGDKFFAVPDLGVARQIVERRRQQRRFAEPMAPRTLRLEDLDKTKVQELKIILKADVRGSIEAIKKELEKLQHEEIKLTVIHAGVGAITEGDVQLALASPEDTLIIGFNVVPDHRAQSLAEQRQVQIRLYHIIYQLTDDLKAALEGRLKPREEIVPLGRAVVREVFKISKVGTVAGCYVIQGVVERGAQVRVIREGRVIYPPTDRTATIESLRRFKEDVREVREGFECGIKVSHFDDVKVDDVLEVFRVVQVQRTLEEVGARSAAS